jgi:hypothetical protein
MSSTLSLMTSVADPARMPKRCLQYWPLAPAEQVQYADIFLPLLEKVTRYGSGDEPFTKKFKLSM